MTSRERMLADYIAGTADKHERKYLVSDSVRDCRLSDRKPPTMRVPARVGVTGGHVDGAKGNVTEARRIAQRAASNRPRNRSAKRNAYRTAAYIEW